jgi:hypothetical protein
MRNGWTGLTGAVVVAATMASTGCSGGGGGAGGSLGNGGAVSAGGSSASGGTVAAGGSSGSGGALSSGGSSGNGGSGGVGGGTSPTALNDSKLLNALSTAEAVQLCDETYTHFGTAIPKEAACKWRGLVYATSSSPPTEAKLRQNCTTKESACLALEASKIWLNPGCGEIPASCTATVAEYFACMDDEVAEFNQKVLGFPACDTFTTAGTTAIWDAQGSPPPGDCASLGKKCPDLYPPILFSP